MPPRIQFANGQAHRWRRRDADVLNVAARFEEAGQDGVAQEAAAGPAIASQNHTAALEVRAQGGGEGQGCLGRQALRR